MCISGTIYLSDCPREKYIPIYLIVAGVFGVFKAILGIIQMVNITLTRDNTNVIQKGQKFKMLSICPFAQNLKSEHHGTHVK
jgi:hypothetical protein